MSNFFVQEGGEHFLNSIPIGVWIQDSLGSSLPLVRPHTSHLNNLCLNFLICKMGILIVTCLSSVCEDEMKSFCNVVRLVFGIEYVLSKY